MTTPPSVPTSVSGPAREPSASLMAISPQMAQRWLDASNAHNRPISMPYCQRLARDMRDGRWQVTHEGIAFSTHGRLLDGQHRLKAITIANVTVSMFVWFDVAPETLMTINNGKSRTLVDALSLSGAASDVDSHDIAILRLMLGGMGRSPVLTPAEAAAAYKEHQEAIEFAKVYLPRKSGIQSVATSDIRALIARAFYSVDLDRLAAFCQVLSTGLATSPADKPVVLLFSHLVRNPGVNESARRDRYARTARALSAYLRQEDIARVYAAGSELFPLPNSR